MSPKLKRTAFAAVLVLLLVSLSAEVCEAQMITAHRGASYDAPENTLAAFNLAWQQGTDAIEADFYLSSDKRIVCIHDKDTLRTAGIKKMVEKTTFADLRALDAGGWKGEAFRGETIPTFEEILATLPDGKRFVIELKTGVEIVPVLQQELKRLAPPHASLMIISFDAESIEKCKQLMPDIQAHWLTAFKAANEKERPLSAAEVAKTVRKCGADGVGMKGDMKIVDRSFIDTLISQGCGEFHVWTVDDAAEARYFQSLGAIGITTNRPALIKDALSQ